MDVCVLKEIDLIECIELFENTTGINSFDYATVFLEIYLTVICAETNAAAERLFLPERVTHKSRINNWQELTVSKL